MSAAEGYEALRQARIAENMARLRQKHGLLLNAGVLLGEAPQPVRFVLFDNASIGLVRAPGHRHVTAAHRPAETLLRGARWLWQHCPSASLTGVSKSPCSDCIATAQPCLSPCSDCCLGYGSVGHEGQFPEDELSAMAHVQLHRRSPPSAMRRSSSVHGPV